MVKGTEKPEKRTLLCVYNAVWTWTVHPLVVQSGLTVRFMSSFTGKSIHCVSHTEIRGCVLRSHIAHLQVQGALVIVSEDSEAILYGWCVVYCTAIRINVSNPLQGLPRCLSNPAHPEATKSEPWAFTRESPWPPRWHQASSSLQQLHFTLDICKHRKCCSINCQTCPVFLIFMSTHIFSIYSSSKKFFTF